MILSFSKERKWGEGQGTDGERGHTKKAVPRLSNLEADIAVFSACAVVLLSLIHI